MTRTTVLVIDDSPTFREALKAAPRGRGLSVVTPPTARRGFASPRICGRSAVIVDGVLPDIDGATVVRRMRLDAALRKTPCMLLTASGDRATELRALESGADAFVRKDDDSEVVLVRLAAMVRGATPVSTDVGEHARAQEDPRGRRQRDVPERARTAALGTKGTTSCWPAPARKRWSCWPCRKSTAFCSTS